MITSHRRQQILRYLGAAALLGVGIDHIQQYYGALYSTIPTIGTLFALNFIACVVLAAGLAAPLERMLPRLGKPILAVLAASGIGVAVSSLTILLVSEHTPIFGFMEVGYRQAIVVSIVLESATTLLLGGFLIGLLRERPGGRPSVPVPS
jgi:ethanolamine transporter EutH